MKTRSSFLEKQYSDIMAGLKQASEREGVTGHTFANILKIFDYHLKRESDTVVPLVDYLLDRVSNEWKFDYEMLLAASKSFDAQYETMLMEHKQMLKLADSVYDEITTDDDDLFELVHDLRRLITIEEEIAYPAAIAAGDLVEMENRPNIH